MCIITRKDAEALQVLADEMALVVGAYPVIPERKSHFSESRFDESEAPNRGVVVFRVPFSCYEQEKVFLHGFSSIQDGEIQIKTLT